MNLVYLFIDWYHFIKIVFDHKKILKEKWCYVKKSECNYSLFINILQKSIKKSPPLSGRALFYVVLRVLRCNLSAWNLE